MTSIEDDGVIPTRAAPQTVSRSGVRAFWTAAHRWTGLIAGLYLVIAGLTGSVLAFWQDIDEWLNRDVMRVVEPAPNTPYRSLDDIVAAARARLPETALARSDTPIYVRFPAHRSGVAQVAYMTGLPTRQQAAEAARMKDASKIDMNALAGGVIFVNPYTAQTTGERFAGWATRPLSMPFVYMMMSLHCALLWEPFGRLALAAVGLFLLLSAIVGVALWWPRGGSFAKALKLKRGARFQRTVYDLHKAIGVYLGVVLIVSIFSGVYMNFKTPWRALVSLISPVRQLKMDMNSPPAAGRAPLSPSAALAAAERIYPDGWAQFVALPRGEEGVYVIGKHLDGEVNQATTSRMVVIDQYGGEALAKQDPREFSAGEKFFEWQYPLHSGEAFGDAGRAFMLCFGLAPLGLYVTGFLRWRHKARSGKSRVTKN